MGTLWQVLNDYVTNLKSVQHVARMWYVGPGAYSVMQPRLAAALTDIASQRDIIRPAIAASVGVPEDERTFLDGLVFDAYAETAAVVMDPSNEVPFGGMKALGVTAPEAETAIKLAERLGKQLLRLVYYIAGIGIATTGYVKWIGPMWFDPNGIHSATSVWSDVEEECAKLIAAVPSGDMDGLARARRRCDQLRSMADNDLPGSGSCGPLDTPYGTLIGLVLGVGFGWAGMRKVMGL
jgi:hypothetical protein